MSAYTKLWDAITEIAGPRAANDIKQQFYRDLYDDFAEKAMISDECGL